MLVGIDGVGSSEEIEDDRAGDYCDVVEACPTLARREQFGPYPVGGLEPVRRAACEDDGVNERSLVTEAEDVGAGSPGPAPRTSIATVALLGNANTVVPVGPCSYSAVPMSMESKSKTSAGSSKAVRGSSGTCPSPGRGPPSSLEAIDKSASSSATMMFIR